MLESSPNEKARVTYFRAAWSQFYDTLEPGWDQDDINFFRVVFEAGYEAGMKSVHDEIRADTFRDSKGAG